MINEMHRIIAMFLYYFIMQLCILLYKIGRPAKASAKLIRAYPQMSLEYPRIQRIHTRAVRHVLPRLQPPDFLDSNPQYPAFRKPRPEILKMTIQLIRHRFSVSHAT